MKNPESRTIPLNRGHFAIVDDQHYEWLSRNKWYARLEKTTGTFYAVRNGYVNGRKTIIWMHREVLGLLHGDGMIGDHINTPNTLDNRLSNLRIVNHAQSVRNRRTPRSNLSGMKGCSFNNGSFLVRIGLGRKTICLGRRKDPEEAKALYAAGVAKYHGEFGRVA